MKLFETVIDSQLTRQGNASAVDFFSNPQERPDDVLVSEGMFGDSLLAVAVNNYAVCAVFLKKVKVALTKLESVIQDNPSQNILDPIIFNLCTIYDLSYSSEVSTNKKKTIQNIASHYGIEEVSWRSFRLA
jgi:hypothetical protein